MKEESLLMSWKKSLQLFSMSNFLDVFRDFGKTSFVILKYFSVLIILFVLAAIKGLAGFGLLLFLFGSFIFFIAAQSPDKKTKFSYFLKAMPLFFRWLLLGCVAGFFATLVFWIGALGVAIAFALVFLLLAKAMGLTITAIYSLFIVNRTAVIILVSIILPFYLSLFYIPMLSRLFFSENKYKGMLRSVKQAVRLSFYFSPLWLFISVSLIFLFLAITIPAHFFEKPIKDLIYIIWMVFCYLFYVSTVATFYRKIQAHVLSLKEI